MEIGARGGRQDEVSSQKAECHFTLVIHLNGDLKVLLAHRLIGGALEMGRVVLTG